MQVTEVQIALIKPRNGMIGFANVVLDDSLYISSIAIHKKLDGSGYRLTFPTRRTANGQQLHIFHPICKEMSKTLEAAIFRKLKDVMSHHNAGYHSPHFEAERV